MSTDNSDFETQSLILAAEECPAELFSDIHVFSQVEERVIQALCAHGPVLVKGGRGSGKSALMIEASRRIEAMQGVIGLYLSLRHVPLLRSTGVEYEKLFCSLLSQELNRKLLEIGASEGSISASGEFSELQSSLREISVKLGCRIVLMFDDVAHLGREASLEEFFGIFRTISSNSVSCKATIYPGVTRFGVRFDVYNDATVFDLSRDERSSGYADLFLAILSKRFPNLNSRIVSARSLDVREVALFLGRSVVGNMRGFIFACSKLDAQDTIGLPAIEAVLKSLSSDYYWPLLEEIEPKLGIYQPLVAASRNLAEEIFKHAASQNRVPTVIIHRDIVQSLSKVFEILEYAGFMSKREASRAMRSGGRGPRYALNLATLLEYIYQARLTRDVFRDWINTTSDQPTDIHSSSGVIATVQPPPSANEELAVLFLPIDKLEKSTTYPYGITNQRIIELKAAGFNTIGDLADASDDELKSVNTIGDKWLQRIRSVVGQAVWM